MQFNKVILAGNLTRDVEIFHSMGGTTFAKFGIAINDSYVSNGEKKERTVFVDMTAFGKTGETIAAHFSKGKPIFIEGRLDFSTWEVNGVSRNKLSVVVDKFKFVGPKVEVEPEADSNIPF